MPSKTPKSSSNTARVEGPAASVYDFLYHDAQRIASFLAQFDDNGHMTQVMQKAAKKSATGSGSQLTGRVGVPLVAGADGNLTTTTSEASDRESQRTYDPLWSNALLLLEYLNEAGLINRNLQQATMGQVVLVKGGLWVMDLGFIKSILDAPGIAPFLPSFMTGAGLETAQAALGLAMVSAMPHLIHAALSARAGSTWSSLVPGGLTMSSSDLLMKHGANIAGEWSMLGILDALPDNEQDSPPPSSVAPYAAAFGQFLPQLRTMMGRPDGAYGVTPLLIFRQIAPGSRQ